MLRRSAIDGMRWFDQRAVPGEDWDMWMRIAAGHDIAFEREVVAHYRIHPTSITSGYTVESVLASHLFTLDGIYGDTAFHYRNTRGYAYACLDRTIALIAARTRKRAQCAGRMLAAVLKSPRILLERETVGVLYEGAKSLLPTQLISLGRKIRHRDVAVRRLEQQA
jgi:hypothetical protein